MHIFLWGSGWFPLAEEVRCWLKINFLIVKFLCQILIIKRMNSCLEIFIRRYSTSGHLCSLNFNVGVLMPLFKHLFNHISSGRDTRIFNFIDPEAGVRLVQRFDYLRTLFISRRLFCSFFYLKGGFLKLCFKREVLHWTLKWLDILERITVF